MLQLHHRYDNSLSPFRALILFIGAGLKLPVFYSLARPAEGSDPDSLKLKAADLFSSGRAVAHTPPAGDAESKSTNARARPVAEMSSVEDLFRGRLRSRIACQACGHVSDTCEPFLDLSLEIPSDSQLGRVVGERGSEALSSLEKQSWLGTLGSYVGLVDAPMSLEACLHSFCTSDTLSEANQYHCDKCKRKVDAKKALAIMDAPEVLVLHIKRFSHNSLWSSKVSRHLSFPVDSLLDLSRFATPATCARGRLKYQLCGLVEHQGSGSGGGHYVACCRQHLSGTWHRFDDRTVSKVSAAQVAQSEAYLLVYRRVLDPSLGAAAFTALQVAQAPDGHIGRRFVSRRWLKKIKMQYDFGPVDNRDLCCPHGVCLLSLSNGDPRAVHVSITGWRALVSAYGGGPEVVVRFV
jgi:hypothetical protein